MSHPISVGATPTFELKQINVSISDCFFFSEPCAASSGVPKNIDAPTENNILSIGVSEKGVEALEARGAEVSRGLRRSARRRH